MSSCCSAKEREEILTIIEDFNREVSDAPVLKFRVTNAVVNITVPDLIKSFEDYAETSKSFLSALKIFADAKGMSMVDYAKIIFDSSRARRGCCSGGKCDCGGGQCSCK